MSQGLKPTKCKGCGVDIVFERLPDGKWLVSEFDTQAWSVADKHNCPNYKPKPKSTLPAGNMPQQQGRISQGLQQATSHNNVLIEQKLSEIARLLSEQNTLLHTWNEYLKEVGKKIDDIHKVHNLHNIPIEQLDEQANKADEDGKKLDTFNRGIKEMELSDIEKEGYEF